MEKQNSNPKSNHFFVGLILMLGSVFSKFKNIINSIFSYSSHFDFIFDFIRGTSFVINKHFIKIKRPYFLVFIFYLWIIVIFTYPVEVYPFTFRQKQSEVIKSDSMIDNRFLDLLERSEDFDIGIVGFVEINENIIENVSKFSVSSEKFLYSDKFFGLFKRHVNGSFIGISIQKISQNAANASTNESENSNDNRIFHQIIGGLIGLIISIPMVIILLMIIDSNIRAYIFEDILKLKHNAGVRRWTASGWR